ncbi:hypothetical protein [Stenotrophomonas maltophilia]|uniref:hypothetical protein n=1 Tax=Stenotrophomonas maltophilia TaxID=40324 RepID=UPI000DA74A3A|nr:hypothetical protein [Stenotrophomonas maltophilia]MDT3432306.1 hypothetical protein [Stenotrophomonas maltophilia]PZT05484.1 hypothetical protein A7X91_01935 [Stenotrophomonas maltophilia]
MTTRGFHRTLRGFHDGYHFVLTITGNVDDVFSYTAEVDGIAVELRPEGVIRSKGDAMQLGMAAVERHVARLPSKD